MKVAPAVEAEVLGVVDAAGSTDVTAPRSAEMERGPAAADEATRDAPVDGGGRGSVEFLGRWNEKYQMYPNERAMPVKMWFEEYNVRLAFSKFVDELVQNGAPSGTFVIKKGYGA